MFISARNSDWMKATLLISGIYGILWGLSVVIFPNFWFSLSGLELPKYLQLWQAYGLFTACLGLGYVIAYSNPLRHWPLVLIGLITKIIIPFAATYYYFFGNLTGEAFRMSFINDVLWWIPFSLILYNAYIHEYLLDQELIDHTEHKLDDILSWYVTSKGETLLELSNKQPIMLVFLRFFGCPFCRETLLEIQKRKDIIKSKGVKVVVVHQLPNGEAKPHFDKFQLSEVEDVSDPELMLYKGFRLKRGFISQIFGLKDLFRLIFKGVIFKTGASTYKDEDPFQMPGVFIIHGGKLLKKFIHTSVSDPIPFEDLMNFKPITG